MSYCLTGVLSQIADELGEEVAVKLALVRGGRTVYIPSQVTPDCLLAQIVGLDAAFGIAQMFGAGYLLIPQGGIRGRGATHRQIKALYKQGLSQEKIADRVDVHIRTVERVIAGMRDDRQLSLFD